MWQLCAGEATPNRAVVARLHRLEVLLQRRDQRLGQDRRPVPGALAAAHDQLPVFKLHVLDAQRECFAQPQARTVEQAADQPILAVQVREHVLHFAGREHHRQVPGLLRPDDAVEPRQLDLRDLLVEEQQRGERLVLRRRRHLAVHRQVREKRLDLGGRHFGGMPLAVKQDEAPCPEQVLLLGAIAVMQRAQLVAHLIEQPGPGFLPGRAPLPIDAYDRAAVVKTAGYREGERVMWRECAISPNGKAALLRPNVPT
jgi:hypothetical protein